MVMSEFENVARFDKMFDIKFDIRFDIKSAWLLCLYLELLPNHDEVKTDSHSKSLLENAHNNDKIL